MSSSESYLCVVDLKRLEQHLAETGQPAYRAGQVWEWTARGVEGYDAMTNLPLALRRSLASEVPFSTLTSETEQTSTDGTSEASERRSASGRFVIAS